MTDPSPDARTRAIATAARLFRRQGYHGTGLSQIIAESGSPRGSFYFYFPGGKEQLGVEAVRLAAVAIGTLLERAAAESSGAPDFLQRVARAFARWLERSAYMDGCPVATVTLETTPGSEPLRAAAEDAYRGWIERVAGQLRGDGVPDARAERLAVLALASLEGGLLVARAQKSTAALEAIGTELAALARAARRSRARATAGRPRARTRRASR